VLLLLHLLWELKLIGMWRHILHLSLQLISCVRQMLLWLDNTHVNVLLMGRSNLLLLLLKEFDLLRKRKLLHW